MINELKKLNKLPLKTYKYLNLNELNLDKIDYENKRYDSSNVIEDRKCGKLLISNNLDMIKYDDISNLEDNIQYGVSEELIQTNEKYHNAGKYIKINQDMLVAKPITLNYILDDKNNVLIDKNIIMAEESSSSTIILNYTNDNTTSNNKEKKANENLHNGQTKLYAKNNSIVHLIVFQNLSKISKNFNSIVSYIGKNAKVYVTIIELGAQTSIVNYVGDLIADNAKQNLNTIYYTKDSDILDLDYNIIQKGQNTKSDIQVKGVMDDKSKKAFKGTIDFKKGSKKAIGSESEDVILMSPDVKCDSVPTLLCTEEDVSGSHAASIGKIDKEKLFYIMSRGLTYNQAQNVIIDAMFSKIIDKIINEEIRQKIRYQIQRRLENEDAGANI